MLLRRRRWWNVLLSLQFPHQQITRADQERYDAEAPDSAFPIIDRSEKEHESQTDHDEDNSSTHVGALALRRRGRREQSCRHWLAFFHHHPDRSMHHPIPRETEIHDHGNDQDRRAKYSQHGNRDNWNDLRRNVTIRVGSLFACLQVSHLEMQPFVPEFLFDPLLNSVRQVV